MTKEKLMAMAHIINDIIKADNIKRTIDHVKSKISSEIPDLTYSDQYKPERDGNVAAPTALFYPLCMAMLPN